jgi:hypothetical protein
MRPAFMALSLAAAATAVSCAGFAPAHAPRAMQAAARPLSVELYDLKYYGKARENRQAPARRMAALPIPELPRGDASPPSSVPAVPRAAAAAIPLPIPPGPEAAVLQDVSSVRLTGKGNSRVMGIALPALPASGAVYAGVPTAGVASAVRGPQAAGLRQTAQTGKAKPAQGDKRVPSADEAPAGPAAQTRQKQTSTAGAPARAAAGPTPQKQSTAAAAAAVTPAAAAPQKVGGAPLAPAPRVREIFARIGDEVEIGLEGEGVVFLGFPVGQSDGILFKSKESRDRKSYFKFKTARIGSYDLGFLQQDNTAGRSSREMIRIHVVSDAEFTAAVDRQTAPAAEAAPPAEPGDLQYAEKLANLGKYDAAVAEYLKSYRDGDAAMTDRIAGLYLLAGSPEAAEKYYRKNMAAPGPEGESAVIGLTRLAIQKKDVASFLSLLKPLLALKEASVEEPLLEAARFQRDAGETGLGLELTRQYVRRYPEGAHRDEIDFIQAGLLEQDSLRRDIQASRDLYRGILDRFPESAFAGAARERLRYIEQHFYLVR